MKLFSINERFYSNNIVPYIVGRFDQPFGYF